MRIPVIRGIIARRILINYQVDPELLQKFLPRPFRPKLIHGTGIAGICLIRLNHIRPQGLPAVVGISSENAAHRIAVEWEEHGELKEGVYIPRRDTSSQLNYLLGGRLFPGLHHQAHFQVTEHNGYFHIVLDSHDHRTHLEIQAHLTSDLCTTSIFSSLAEASLFFKRGSLGYSPAIRTGSFDGLELRSFNWKVEPLTVERVVSSFFDQEFPSGSVQFDSALLMGGIEHEWHGRESLC